MGGREGGDALADPPSTIPLRVPSAVEPHLFRREEPAIHIDTGLVVERPFGSHCSTNFLFRH